MHEPPSPSTVTPNRFRRLRAIFEAALEQAAPERVAFVERACAGDANLLADVMGMLDAEAATHGALPRASAGTDITGIALACPACRTPLASGHRFCPICGSAATVEGEPPARFRTGAIFAARFRIVALLGRGGMGEVYRADDLEVGQPVALKFLTSLRSDPRARVRLRSEVRLARQIAHPNICRVYDIGEANGELYLSMEYVDGEDLAALLKRIGRLPIDKGLEIARKLCAGLAAAHAKGVLHRDFKPSNIMIDGRGEVRIMDFGLAAAPDQIETHDIRSGTPAYMAPEQLDGKEATKHSDLYALGLVLYELFTGKAAFTGTTLDDLLRLRREMPTTTPSTLIPEITPRLEQVILRCLEPEPKLRPATALEVAASLPGGDPLAEALAAGETPSPEMVAAAGPIVGLGLSSVITAVIIVVTGLIAVMAMTPVAQVMGRLPFRNSPEVLTVRARDILRSLGYPEPWVDAARGFQVESGYREHHQRSIIGTWAERRHAWNRVLGAPPYPVTFWYRESPAPLVPTLNTRPMQRVALDDPPRITPGMISVVVDLSGRLQRLTAIPTRIDASDRPAVVPDWSGLFKAAGLDVTTFAPAAPTATQTPADVRRAWTGTLAERPDVPVRVEAASFGGRVTAFELRFPWSPRGGATAPAPLPTVAQVFQLLLILATVVVARHNVLKGRSDTANAYRIGVAFAVLMSVQWILAGHHTSAAHGLGSFMTRQVARFFFEGVMASLTYLAIEPFIRRYWPESLITWSRALAGRWRDPVVGRDVLMGIVWGVVSTLSIRLLELGLVLTGHPPAPPELTYSSLGFPGEKLMGTSLAVADAIGYVLAGGAFALQNFFVLFILKVVLRRSWLIVAASCAFFTLLNSGLSGANAEYLGVLALVTSLTVFVALRFGLLATSVFAAVAMFTDGFLLTPDLGSSFGPTSLAALIVVCALTLWAARTTLHPASATSVR